MKNPLLRPCPYCGGMAYIDRGMRPKNDTPYIEAQHNKKCLMRPNTWLLSSRLLKDQIRAWNMQPQNLIEAEYDVPNEDSKTITTLKSLLESKSLSFDELTLIFGKCLDALKDFPNRSVAEVFRIPKDVVSSADKTENTDC